MKKILSEPAHGFDRHMQNVGKLVNFFSHNRIPKALKNHFYRFWTKCKANRKLQDFSGQKQQKM